MTAAERHQLRHLIDQEKRRRLEQAKPKRSAATRRASYRAYYHRNRARILAQRRRAAQGRRFGCETSSTTSSETRDLRLTQKLMRHKSIRTTADTYLHDDASDLAEAMAAMPPWEVE